MKALVFFSATFSASFSFASASFFAFFLASFFAFFLAFLDSEVLESEVVSFFFLVLSFFDSGCGLLRCSLGVVIIVPNSDGRLLPLFAEDRCRRVVVTLQARSRAFSSTRAPIALASRWTSCGFFCHFSRSGHSDAVLGTLSAHQSRVAHSHLQLQQRRAHEVRFGGSNRGLDEGLPNRLAGVVQEADDDLEGLLHLGGLPLLFALCVEGLPSLGQLLPIGVEHGPGDP